MAAGLPVSCRAHQIEYPQPYIGRTSGTTDRPRPYPEAKHDSEVADHQPLPESVRLARRRQDQVIDVARVRISDGAAQRLRREDDVGVGEEQPFAGRLVAGDLQRVVLAEP